MIGTKLAHYEITSHLGSGGMGDVYQATDSKLGRSVAIKLLPEAFTHDRDRAARFEREARVLAALNHSNIAAIHGIEEFGGRKFLVMELVSGETLADRIKRGPIPIDEALPIAKQIAEALEAAHEKGIIHRDLKPANIKVTPQGQVKVLDFGLAKAFAGNAADVNLSNSPTLSMTATQAGVILGTAAYMSPEQSKGKETDRTTDIWAFGCVLYEMLTGHAAFEGETLGEILGSVFKAEPAWKRLPAETPAAIRRLLGRCLQKDRNLRLRDAGDARLDILERRDQVETAARRGKGRERFAWIAFAVAVVGLAVLTVMYIRVESGEFPETRLDITIPLEITTARNRLSSTKVSPDGRTVVFSAAADGKPTQLWLRSLDSEAAQPLAGTEGAAWPFWSPDSRSIGFIALGKLMRIDLGGGGARPLAEAPNGPGGGAWGPDGTILFTSTATSPLYRIPASGGPPVEVTHLSSPAEASHRFPDFLPDGRHFLFFVAGTNNVQGVYLGSLDTKETRRLLESDSAAAFAEPNYVLFRREENLLAQRLDIKTFETVGDPIFVAERVSGPEGTAGEVAVSTSDTGLIAYRAPINNPLQLTWFDRAGRQTGALGDMIASLSSFRISPDGHTVALTQRIKGNPDVWLMETARGVMRPFTSEPGIDGDPVWAPNSDRIAFQSRRSGANNIWLKHINGGTEERLRESVENEVPVDWSLDGRFILFTSGGSQNLWALPVAADGKPVAVANTSFAESDGRFSPDGRRVAYQSNETGRNEIYVVPFPGPGAPTRVSTNGGVTPSWRNDGREIFYLGPDNQLTAVLVTPQPNGKLGVGTPTALFPIPQGAPYDVTRDGQRILVGNPVGQATTPPITIILNWKPKP